jgi:hypothetical protein
MDKKAAQGKRSPLKRKPMRNPGESIQREMGNLLEDEWVPSVFFATVIVLFAGYEWMRSFFALPPQPLWMTACALLAVGYAAYKFVTIRKRFKALKLGLEGEKTVGQYLEDLRSQGCRVFHDIVGNRFNIDHVVVSPHGIFVIETKTYSKPSRGEAFVEFDGERILVNGIEPDRNAVRQVRAAGDWLRDLLTESTSRKFSIKCAVVFPGWFVEDRAKNKSDVWVLNPKALPSFIEHEPVLLTTEDVALASSRIISHMQTID